MKPSDCEHVWIKGPGVNKICMWCGIPQVRKSSPVPKLKIPAPERHPYAGVKPVRWRR